MFLPSCFITTFFLSLSHSLIKNMKMWKYLAKSSPLISVIINFHCSCNPSTHSSHEKATATFEIQCCHLPTTTATKFLQFYFVQTPKTSAASTPRHPYLLRTALPNHALAFQSKRSFQLQANSRLLPVSYTAVSGSCGEIVFAAVYNLLLYCVLVFHF